MGGGEWHAVVSEHKSHTVVVFLPFYHPGNHTHQAILNDFLNPFHLMPSKESGILSFTDLFVSICKPGGMSKVCTAMRTPM